MVPCDDRGQEGEVMQTHPIESGGGLKLHVREWGRPAGDATFDLVGTDMGGGANRNHDPDRSCLVASSGLAFSKNAPVYSKA